MEAWSGDKFAIQDLLCASSWRTAGGFWKSFSRNKLKIMEKEFLPRQWPHPEGLQYLTNGTGQWWRRQLGGWPEGLSSDADLNQRLQREFPFLVRPNPNRPASEMDESIESFLMGGNAQCVPPIIRFTQKSKSASREYPKVVQVESPGTVKSIKASEAQRGENNRAQLENMQNLIFADSFIFQVVQTLVMTLECA